MKTWKDVYLLDLELDLSSYWAIDQKNNFVFQFEIEDEEYMQQIINVVNGNKNLDRDDYFEYINTLIVNSKGVEIIMIRGYGYLTGIGGLNLSDKEASNIQDTFGQFIVDRLNER